MTVQYVVEDSPAVLSTLAGAERTSRLSEVGKQQARKNLSLQLHSKEESGVQRVDEQGLLEQRADEEGSHEGHVISSTAGETEGSHEGHVISPVAVETSLTEGSHEGHVTSPAGGESTGTEEERSSRIGIGSPHSVHEHRKGLQSFLSTGELAKWSLKAETRSEEGRAKSAPATTVAPSLTRPHADSPANTSQASKTSLLEVVQQNIEVDSPSRGSSESSQASSSSDIYHSFSGEEFQHPMTSDSPFISAELTMPYSSEWKRKPAPLTSSSDWNRDRSPLTSSLTESVLTTVSGGAPESTVSVQSAISISSGITETAKVRLTAYIYTV